MCMMSKSIRKCPGFESFQRMNYLLQIRNFMATEVDNKVLACYYGNLVDSIAKKSVIRIDTPVKRQTCKKCKGPLINGETATVKIKNNKNKQKTIIWRCNFCQFSKKYPINSKNKLWMEQADSVVEILNYSTSK